MTYACGSGSTSRSVRNRRTGDALSGPTVFIVDTSVRIEANDRATVNTRSAATAGKPNAHTAVDVNDGIRRFRITHPYHPLRGLEFESLEARESFGRQVFVFEDPQGRKVQVPTAWTDAAAPDPFLAISQGRAYLRVEDLLGMGELIRGNRR